MEDVWLSQAWSCVSCSPVYSPSQSPTCPTPRFPGFASLSERRSLYLEHAHPPTLRISSPYHTLLFVPPYWKISTVCSQPQAPCLLLVLQSPPWLIAQGNQSPNKVSLCPWRPHTTGVSSCYWLVSVHRSATPVFYKAFSVASCTPPSDTLVPLPHNFPHFSPIPSPVYMNVCVLPKSVSPVRNF